MSKMKDSKKTPRFDIYGLVISLLGFGILIWYFIMLIPDHLNVKYPLSIETSALVGDFVGGVVATLFSIAAFFLLYETLITQKADIEENQKILNKQSFETNLFQMINIQNDIVKEFDIRSGKVSKVVEDTSNNNVIALGRDSFYYVYSNYLAKNIIKSRVTSRQYIKEDVFGYLFQEWKEDLNHYFKHACAIIMYIYQSSPDKQETKYYLHLFESGLSDSEIVLLYYYVLFHGNKELISIIVENGFFNDLPKERLIDPSHKQWLYE